MLDHVFLCVKSGVRIVTVQSPWVELRRPPSLCLSPGGGEIGIGSLSVAGADRCLSPVGGEIGIGSLSVGGGEIGIGSLSVGGGI